MNKDYINKDYMKNTFDNVMNEVKTMIVDGAMATELETMGCDLNDELWSAKVLAEQPELIKKVHLSYFKAGADCGNNTRIYEKGLFGGRCGKADCPFR